MFSVHPILVQKESLGQPPVKARVGMLWAEGQPMLPLTESQQDMEQRGMNKLGGITKFSQWALKGIQS